MLVTSNNCSLQAISPCPTVFSKGLFPKDIKRFYCVGMGKIKTQTKAGFRKNEFHHTATILSAILENMGLRQLNI